MENREITIQCQILSTDLSSILLTLSLMLLMITIQNHNNQHIQWLSKICHIKKLPSQISYPTDLSLHLFCHCRFFTHQVLVFVEHVQLIGRKLPSPVEEIVHRVVPGLRPQVWVLHVRQDPVVRLDRVFQLVSKYRRDFVSYCITSMNTPPRLWKLGVRRMITTMIMMGTCSMTRVSLVVSSSFICFSSRCCCALSK